MKYLIVEANSAAQLQEKVQYFINQGWELQGGIAVDTNGAGNWWYYQAMVQREKN
jgi:hypothetical protein